MVSTIRLLAFPVVAVAISFGGPPMAPAPSGPSCPPGQHEDAQTPGFQCVPGWCPEGTMLDGVTGTCVAPPGVPPPPLS